MFHDSFWDKRWNCYVKIMFTAILWKKFIVESCRFEHSFNFRTKWHLLHVSWKFFTIRYYTLKHLICYQTIIYSLQKLSIILPTPSTKIRTLFNDVTLTIKYHPRACQFLIHFVELLNRRLTSGVEWLWPQTIEFHSSVTYIFLRKFPNTRLQKRIT